MTQPTAVASQHWCNLQELGKDAATVQGVPRVECNCPGTPHRMKLFRHASPHLASLAEILGSGIDRWSLLL